MFVGAGHVPPVVPPVNVSEKARLSLNEYVSCPGRVPLRSYGRGMPSPLQGIPARPAPGRHGSLRLRHVPI